jgi:hypothetical protein
VQRHDRGGPVTAALLPRVRVAGFLLLCVHLGLVAWLTLRPVSVPWVAPANLTPLATIRAGLEDGSPQALSGLGGSLMLLAPLGVLLPLATGRLRGTLPGTWASTVSGGALISALLVLVRSAVPGHRVNIDSVVLNTAGVALVCLLLFPLVRAWLLRREGGQARTRASGGGGGTGGTRARGMSRLRRMRQPRSGTTVTVRGRGGALRRQEEPEEGPTPRAARVGIAP